MTEQPIEPSQVDPHLLLRALVAELRAEPAPDVLVRLGALLPPHFRDEERPGGFLDRLIERGLVEESARLRAQHQTMLVQLEAVELSDSSAVLALAGALERHEWEESCLLAGSVDT
jgi:hypothetical protein